MSLPLVTLVIPTCNEASDIEGCLACIARQDYPLERLEVVVVDGSSSDGTADLAREVLEGSGFAQVHVIDNPHRTTPSNLNRGLEVASGELICRVDARTRIQPHYVRTCAEVLAARSDVAVVGGAQIAVARSGTARAVGIARALNNRWSMGGSPYRRRSKSGPSDTVYLGSFRAAQLRNEGGWDDRLPSNQDFDLNRRMGQRGLVWFDARLRSGYLPRETFGSLWKQYRRFGRAKVDYWKLTGSAPERRQWLLMVGPLVGLVIGAILLKVLSQPARIALVGATCVVVSMLEHRGSDEPRGSLAAHLMGSWAMAVVSTGWLIGVLGGLILKATRDGDGAGVSETAGCT